MKYLHLLTFVVGLFLTPFSSFAQMGNCDSLQIIDIQLNPFDPDYIMVRSSYNDFDHFISLPTFSLVDEDEFILAMEALNFFGMSLEQIHSLEIIDIDLNEGVAIPAVLELWSMNYDNLECTITDEFLLWPVHECVPLTLTITRLGADIATGNLNWKISDLSGIAQFTDSLLLDSAAQSTSFQICLPKGCGYELEIGISDFDGLAVSYILHYSNSLAIGASDAFETDGNHIHPFNLYSCISTSIEAHQTMDFQIYPNPAEDLLQVHLPAFRHAQFHLTDLHGRLVKTFGATASPFQLDLSDLPVGMYLLTVIPEGGQRFHKRVVVAR